MGPVGDAQGGRVGVNAVGDHSVEDVVAWGQPVTGQEPHDARVTVVELGRASMEKLSYMQQGPPARPPARPGAGQHSQAAWR